MKYVVTWFVDATDGWKFFHRFSRVPGNRFDLLLSSSRLGRAYVFDTRPQAKEIELKVRTYPGCSRVKIRPVTSKQLFEARLKDK